MWRLAVAQYRQSEPYVSQTAFNDYRAQRADNLEYLQQMVLENLDDSTEQMPLIKCGKIGSKSCYPFPGNHEPLAWY